MNVKTHLAVALLAVATGCASHHDKIVFSDEADLRALTAAAAPAAQKRLDKADELQIEQSVFSYLLERRLWDLATYSAIFLQADDAQVAALMNKYPDHVPPIKPSKRAKLKSHRPPLDRDTKKPAMILTVEVNEPNLDGTVDAVGRWYAGDAVTGFRAFRLQKGDAGWQITEVK